MNGYLYPAGLSDTLRMDTLKTGDIAEMMRERFVMVYDRRKDLIISGGKIFIHMRLNQLLKHIQILMTLYVAQGG